MPLTTPDPPEDVVAALGQGLDAIMSFPEEDAPELPASIRVGDPHRVYSFSLTELEAGALRGAEPSGWRFLVDDGERVFAAAEVTYDEDVPLPPRVDFGQAAASTEEAFEQAESSVVDEGPEYEFRVASVPELYVLAVWLHEVDGEDDVFVPLSPTPPGLTPGYAQNAESFISRLRAIAGDDEDDDDNAPDDGGSVTPVAPLVNA